MPLRENVIRALVAIAEHEEDTNVLRWPAVEMLAEICKFCSSIQKRLAYRTFSTPGCRALVSMRRDSGTASNISRRPPRTGYSAGERVPDHYRQPTYTGIPTLGDGFGGWWS